MKEDVDYTEAVEKAKQGDQHAKEVLYIETCQHMFFLAKSIVKSDEEAMDIIHDSYICVFQKLDNIKNAAGFKSYLRTTVANRCKNYLRKKKPLYLSDMTEDGTELELEDTDGVIPGELVGNEDVIECVRRVVESLPEEQRMCVILRYYDEMSLQEIADTLEVSLGTVKSRLSRASKKMRDEIERLEKEENKKFRCIIPFFWLRAGLEGMENETDVPKALEVKLFGKSIKRGVSKMARNIIVAAAALAIAGGVFLTACGNDEDKKDTTSSLADTSSVSSAAEESSSEAEVKEPKVFECELAAKLSDDKIDTAAFASGEEKIALDKLGVQSISLNIKLATGEEELWNITVTVVDSEKPEFSGIKDKYEITEGGKLPDFKKGVSVKDNYDESVEFIAELDGKAKKSDYKAGEYTITYKAKDSSGNEVTATSKLIIKEKPEEEKKDDEKSEETSDNNNNGNSDNNGGCSSNNNGGGNSNNGGNGGGSSNNNGGNGNGGSQNNGGGSSSNNGGGNSNNNGGGNSGSGGGGQVWTWDDDDGHHRGTIDDGTTPGGNTEGTGTQQYGDPFGWGYDYWYVVYPNGEITTL